MSSQRKIVIILLIGLLSTIIAIIPEILGDDAKALCEQYLGENYKLYVIIFFIVGSLLLMFLTTDIREGIFPTNAKIKDDRESIEKAIVEIRAWLIESYQKRLDSKMASRQPINLQLKYSLEGTTTKAPLYDNKTIRAKLIKEELISVFDKHGGRLLIIGEAGGGKTTLLLQLAVSLLEREQTIIPIIINIVTWRNRFKSVEDWLNELLPQMGVSKSLATFLIKESLLLPLFDGLDELKEEYRESCLKAIGNYGRINNLQYVICSRIVEYSQTTDAPVYCQIKVRPLTLTQIKKQLKEANTPESKGMLHAISNDKLLAEVIKIPFYLNTLQIVLSSSKTIEELSFQATDLEGRKSELIKYFVNNCISNVPYPNKRTELWLCFISLGMNTYHLAEFQLTDLQYDWWNLWNGVEKAVGKFLQGFILIFFGVLIGTISATIFSIFVGANFLKSMFPLLMITVLGLILFPFFVKGLPFITTKERINFSIKNNHLKIKKNTIIGLVAGVILFLSTLVLASSSKSLLMGIVGGVTITLGLILGNLFTYGHYDFIYINKPYQKFITSLYSLYFSILQHFLLRYQLYRKGFLPLKLVTFLNHLTEHRILESNGASWRFRHRILQDHFFNLLEKREDTSASQKE